jgi:tryptophan-rich sensory protein
MITWIAKIHWGKVLLVGLIYTIISVVVRQVEMLWTMKYYEMPRYFGLWNPLMMPKAGPPPTDFFIVSTIITFTIGVSLTIVYYYLKECLPKNYWKRTFFFADLMVATSFIFFTLPSYLLFNIPVGLLASWFASTFVMLVVTSVAITKIIGK